jgi:formylglycine-generating enzyme required for sulfatase activity/serine/threonine protein kinase
MNCPKCQTEVPDKFKFCPECGSSLSAVSEQSGVEGDVSIGNLKTVLQGMPDDGSDSSGREHINSLGDMPTMVGGGSRPDAGLHHEPLNHRYELHDEIGRGGFAVVYKATDRKLRRTVAIKKLLKDSDEVEYQTLERFKREARVIAGLNHRNVVGVYDVGEDDDGIYLVMEYISGGSLRELLKEKDKLELPEALMLMRGMVQGLSHAHRNNLVHRDIKPANILLQKDEQGELTPKIVDFGLAQAGRDSELSMSGYGMGTPWYMPPEQRRDAKNVNHTADIYALGKVLYEMVTGEIPDQLDPAVIPPPPLLSQIIFKCTKPKPADRYFSVDELLQSLEQIEAPKSRKIISRKSSIGNENQCPACGQDNPDDVKFCEGCGGGLFRNCPECDRENSVNKQFCGGCGTDVEGFAASQEILQRMEAYTAEKKWSRVVKEYGLFDQDIRLPGKKGAELRMKLEKVCKNAQELQAKREELKKRIEQSVSKEDHLEEALGLIHQYQEIDPANDAVNNLPKMIEGQIDERDYQRALEKVRGAKDDADITEAMDLCNGYLKVHPDGKYVAEVKYLVEGELLEQLANFEYARLRTFIDGRRKALGRVSGLETMAHEYAPLVKRCETFLLLYPGNKNAAAIQQDLESLKETLVEIRGEIAYQLLLQNTQPKIERKRYYVIESAYRDYQAHHKTRETEVRQMLEETLPALKAVNAVEIRRKKRKRAVEIGISVIFIAVVFFAFFAVDRYRLNQDIEAFNATIEARKTVTADLGNGITMAFMPIAAGSFQMGSDNGDSDEKPVHRVMFTKPFWMAKTEVTQAQYEQIMGENPSYFKRSDLPVECVSWNDAMEFCRKLTEHEQQAGRLPAGYEYSLPTEAQWEYACRAVTTGDYAGNLDALAWYSSNSGSKTHPVGTKKGNAWGLYDMHGNVWEWCLDDWHGSYNGAPADGTRWGDGSGSYRVKRGGSWNDGASDCRSANRHYYSPEIAYGNLGFRPLVLQR